MITPTTSINDAITQFDFDTISVTTKTYIIATKTLLNLESIYNNIDPDDIDDGVLNEYFISSLKYREHHKGVIKIKKKNTRTEKWFRNSLTIVVRETCSGNYANVKVCQNGVLQITGCKTLEHIINTVKYLWIRFEKCKRVIQYDLTTSTADTASTADVKQPHPECIDMLFIPAMRNIDFSLGFNLDREKLAHVISKHPSFYCLLETSFGYTGVNIKIPLQHNIEDVDILRMRRTVNGPVNAFVPFDDKYSTYLDTINSEKERDKKKRKRRYVTCLCFYSGKIIISGIDAVTTRPIFNELVSVFISRKHEIMETIINTKSSSLTINSNFNSLLKNDHHDDHKHDVECDSSN